MSRFLITIIVFLFIVAGSFARATETENLGIRTLPAPGKVAVDGKFDDWDLTGGIFACGDAENAAKQFAVWFHTMYDADNLYMLARWVDPTPMNHHGSIKGDYGFVGDCLQVRVVTAPDITALEVSTTDQNLDDAPNVRNSHLTAWRDRDKLDVIDIAYGRRFTEGGMKDAKTQGATQAFQEDEDRKGYVQELAIPWKLLTKPTVQMKPGSKFMITLEPNFVVGTGGRLTIKDLFKPDVAIDRVFTFMGNGCWGYSTLEASGTVKPQPVRLADGREFPVRIEKGIPVVDWTGLVKSKLPDGFKTIKITAPEDGYVSLNLFAPDGTVARQLLTKHFVTKGEHEIKWDGLTTASFRKPGEVVKPGVYNVEGFFHTGIGLRLRGYAANSGSAPWRGWGADHGDPIAVAAAGDMVYAGWSGGEGDKPLVAADLQGNVRWKNIRGGIASAGPIASDGTTVYAFNNVGQYVARAIYRVDAKHGGYTEWSDYKSTDLKMENLWEGEKDIPEQPSALAAADGRVFVSFSGKNAVLVVDANTGKVQKKLEVPHAGAVAAASGKQIFVSSTDNEIVDVDVESGQRKSVVKPVVENKGWVTALAVDKQGQLYLGIRDGDHQVLVYNQQGQAVRTIGRKGGRALVGPWTPDGLFKISGLAIDAEGKLWVAEDDGTPRRISVWDTATGKFKFEMFGASSYGAIGACVNPQDPNLMVGQGCEWRNDPKTGRSVCLGTVTREGMGASRFGFGPNGKLYLATTGGFLVGGSPVRIYERLGDANYKLRTVLRLAEKDGSEPGKKVKLVEVWSDGNDDAQQQPNEVKSFEKDLEGWLMGWYMPMTPDLTFYGSMFQVKPSGWTACGAPIYDIASAKRLPGPANAGARGGMGAQHGHGSADNRLMLWNATYGDDHSSMDCYDIDSGKLLWTYPSNFTGVHGSHRACGPTVGMLRGAYDICGSAKLPEPIGNVWFVPTNKGEWHVITEKGFYLTQLWESDPTRVTFPDQAVPGVSLDTCPPGAGEEAFGGSITQDVDGKISVQAGHISFWNAELVGIDSIKALPGDKVVISEDDIGQANSWQQKYLKDSSQTKRLVARRATPQFTGNVSADFGESVVRYEKDSATACGTGLAWDDQNLYIGWNVKDGTPWVNGADAPEFMYARGDTVDLQIAADANADKGRTEAVQGDVRISIGAFQGQPTVVAYRKVSNEKHPKQFSSGVIKGYEMDSVVVLTDAKVEVKPDLVQKRYVVEAAIPLEALGIRPSAGLVLRGDVGATHGNKDGNDTAMRTHWSNQNTGLVSDEVFELQMSPALWGEIEFK